MTRINARTSASITMDPTTRTHADPPVFRAELEGAHEIAEPSDASTLATRLRAGELTVAEATEEIASCHLALVPEPMRSTLRESVCTYLREDPVLGVITADLSRALGRSG